MQGFLKFQGIKRNSKDGRESYSVINSPYDPASSFNGKSEVFTEKYKEKFKMVYEAHNTLKWGFSKFLQQEH